MAGFQYTSPLTRLVVGVGAVERVGAEVDGLGLSRALLIVGQRTRRSHLFAAVVASLGARLAEVFDGVVEHPDTAVVEHGAEVARNVGAEVLVAVGGGSTSDAAKAMAILLAEGGHIEDHVSKELRRPKLPIMTIPTTASAAEMTPGLAVRTPQGQKLLFWDPKLASRVVVLDPRANLEVPVELMATTAMNAVAHCVEGLYSRGKNPISDALALQGLRLLHQGVPRMVEAPGDVSAREQVQVGSAISGQVITNARIGIHHACCHCIGARCGVPHGVANAIMLPHSMRYNAEVAAVELGRAATAMGWVPTGAADGAMAAIEAVQELQRRAKVPTRLRDVGVKASALPLVAEDVLLDSGLRFNPRPTISAEPVLDLLRAAW